MMSLSPHRYEGYWRNDQPHGVGRMTNPKGEVRRTLHTQRRRDTYVLGLQVEQFATLSCGE
jgi:hypothetical protein